MICPHCNKAIDYHKGTALRGKVLKLHKQGYSCRDIESLLNRKVSFSTASRWIRDFKESNGKT